MSISQFMSILRARKWLALAVFLTVVGSTLAVSLLLPKQYTAVASVVVDAKPDPVSTGGFSAAAIPGFIATQADIMSSDRVAIQVIRSLKLADNASLREEWRESTNGSGSFELWLADTLQKKLDVKPSRESNVITVGYQATDPRFAAVLANAFVDAYIKTTLDLRVDPAQNVRKLFDAQVREAREALEKSQAKLSTFQRENGIFATDERLDVESARLNELSSQLTQFQAISAESTSRQAQARGAQSERLPDVLNNSVVAGLKVDLARAEARFNELGAKFGSSHPQLIEAQANIAELKQRIAGETQKVTGGVGITNSINRAREAQVRRELELQRDKVLQMKAVRDVGLVLQREVESAQRIYDNLAVRLSQTVLDSQNTQSYANVLTLAQPPVLPSSPKIVLNMAAAIFLGACFALGVVLVREMLDRRVRTADDVVRTLGLPVLGTLPGPKAARYLAGARPLPVPLPAPTRQ